MRCTQCNGYGMDCELWRKMSRSLLYIIPLQNKYGVVGQFCSTRERDVTEYFNAAILMKCIPKNLWDVNLASNGGGLVLCGGWSRFARENNLQPGHSCVFELVTKETHTDNSALLNVTISRPIYNAAVI
ncbi:hypothetical protein G4B88_001929 [Cannabis sativa]|nr:hypothetical protein G4B88_001929 [Cannabis sativa]